MQQVQRAILLDTPALTVVLITTATLAKMLDAYGAKTVNAEDKEILQAALLSKVETVMRTASTSRNVDLAM